MGLFRVSKKIMKVPLMQVKPLLDKKPVNVKAAMAVFKPVLSQISDFDSQISYDLKSMLKKGNFDELALFWSSVKRTRAFSMLILFGIFLLAVGIFLLIISLHMKQKDDASTKWPYTYGRVIESRVGSTKGSSGSGRPSNVGGTTGSRGGGAMSPDVGVSSVPRSILHFPIIHYTYKVNGRHYNSNRVYIDNSYKSSNKKKHADIIAKYPIGKKIKVFYNPQKPEQAVLIQGDSPRTGPTKNFGIVITLLGVFFLLLFVLTTIKKILNYKRAKSRILSH